MSPSRYLMRACTVLLYIAIASVGCRLPTNYELQVERSVDSGQRARILEAVADWEENVRELHVSVVDAHGGCAGEALIYQGCITIDAESEWGLHEEAPGMPNVGGIDIRLDPARGYASDIGFYKDLSYGEMGRVLRHELGHAFGLPHYGPNTIMDPNPKTWVFIVTPRDAVAFRALR
jgi:hypothetical protein